MGAEQSRNVAAAGECLERICFTSTFTFKCVFFSKETICEAHVLSRGQTWLQQVSALMVMSCSVLFTSCSSRAFVEKMWLWLRLYTIDVIRGKWFCYRDEIRKNYITGSSGNGIMLCFFFTLFKVSPTFLFSGCRLYVFDNLLIGAREQWGACI